MRSSIYKMPPNKPLLKIEDLDARIENIIDEKLKPIYEKLEKYENPTKFIMKRESSLSDDKKG